MKKSAGILLYRYIDKTPEVLLVHPGGPLWENKDDGVWSVPKGEFEKEDPLTAAKREFKEETGTDITGQFIELLPVKQKSGKIIYVWLLSGDLDTSNITSNLFELEWPPKSGNKTKFPEIDKAAWFTLDEARKKINPGQTGFINQLEELLSTGNLF